MHFVHGTHPKPHSKSNSPSLKKIPDYSPAWNSLKIHTSWERSLKLTIFVEDGHEGNYILFWGSSAPQNMQSWCMWGFSSISPYILCSRQVDLMLHWKWVARIKDFIKGYSTTDGLDSALQLQRNLYHQLKHVQQADNAA